MNKLSIIICCGIALLFGCIFFFSQSNTFSQSTAVPTLPPAANFFMATQSAQQKQAKQPQQQQQVQGQQTVNPQAKATKPVFGVEEGVKASYSATIKTSKGNITVILFGDVAPRTVKNFLEKAEKNYYKNLLFHRVEDWVVQGGDPQGNGTGGGLMMTELNATPFVAGSLGVAGVPNQNGQIVSNDSQFFITKTDAPHLNQQYTNFGMVTDGMEVVNKIAIGDKIIGITINQ